MRTGDRIRLARDRLRMTQKDLAGSDFHRSLISQIETGLIEPSLHTLTVLADRVGLPTSYFIESEGEKQRADRATEEVRRLIATGEYNKAYQVLLDTLTSVSSFPLRGALLVEAGDTLLRDRRPWEALTHLRVAERYLRVGDDINMLIDCLTHTGRALHQLGQLRSAADTFHEALWLLDHAAVVEAKEERLAKRRLKIDLTLSIGRTWTHLGDFKKAQQWILDAINLATDAGLYFELGLAHQAMALAHHPTVDIRAARHHNNIALALFEDVTHPVQRSISLSYSAFMAYMENDTDTAWSSYQEALQGIETQPEYQLVPVLGLAIASFRRQEYAAAAAWSGKALAILDAWSCAGTFTHRHTRFASSLSFAAHLKETAETPEIEGLLKPELSWYCEQGFTQAILYTMERSAADLGNTLVQYDSA